MEDCVMGIDIGGTNTGLGIVNRKGDILVRNSLASVTHSDYRIFLDRLCEVIADTMEAAGQHVRIGGIGIGAPNGNYYNGSIEFATNLRFDGVVPVVEYLKKKFSRPVIVLTNDANAAAIGEMVYGGARGMKDFIMITLGTGVGSGIVVNGELVYGHDGCAGEIGHTIFDPEGRKCGCGRLGCLETYASAPGIKRTVFELLAKTSHPSVLRKLSYEQLSARMIDEAARKGDPIALEAFDYTGKVLGIKLADAVAHTSPEAIFLFGGLAQAGELLFKPVLYYLNQYLLPIFRNKIKLLPSRLPESDAAILGAGALAWKEMGENFTAFS